MQALPANRFSRCCLLKQNEERRRRKEPEPVLVHAFRVGSRLDGGLLPLTLLFPEGTTPSLDGVNENTKNERSRVRCTN
jgi:hypothetical protein